VVACRDQIRYVLACDAEGLFQEADDHMRRRTHRIEDITGVNYKVHIAFQDDVHSPPVSLLDVHLPLITARLLVELRVPTISKVSIRDVGYADYFPAILSISSLRYSIYIAR